MPTTPHSEFAISFLASAVNAVMLKDARAQFEIMFKSLKGQHPFSACNLNEAIDSTSFNVHHAHEEGKTYVVGCLTLNHQYPSIIEARIYDAHYGWQASPTLIPLNVEDPNHQEKMAEFSRNIASGISVDADIEAKMIRIREFAL